MARNVAPKSYAGSPVSIDDDHVINRMAARAAAMAEMPANIRFLAGARDNPKLSSAARVRATVALCEIAGSIGKDKLTERPISGKPMAELHPDEIAQLAANGRAALAELQRRHGSANGSGAVNGHAGDDATRRRELAELGLGEPDSEEPF